MEFKDILKSRREELGLTLEDIGTAVGVAKGTVQRWEAGIIKNLKRDKIGKLAKILKVSPAYLMGWDEELDEKYNEPNIVEDDEVVTFPVLGCIAAGYEEIAIEDWSGSVMDVPKKYLKGREKSDFFVLEVHGNSMYPLYHEKDKVLILKQNYIERNGDVGAVIYDGECATLKRVDVFDDMVKLSPVNPEYQPKELKGADMETYHILGVPRLLVREIS